MRVLKTRFAPALFLFLAMLSAALVSLSARAATVTGDEWTTPEAVRVNQTDARAIMIPFNDVESAKKNPTIHLGKNSPNYIDLNGTWKFNWVSKPSEKPDVEGVTSIPEDGYFDITVPSSWQTNMQYAGWKGTEIDWPIYNNQDYPWQASGNGVSAQSRGDGSAAPADYNPVGTYMRTVHIDQKDMGKRFIITFLGVESGYYLYVNGQAVGYDEDSATTGEFDITDYVKAGDNLITVQVYHYTTGSYLENQDMIYFAGIHRDVFITMQPQVSIYDYNVDTTFEDHDYTTGTLELDVDVTNVSEAAVSGYQVKAYLYDDEGEVVSTVNGLQQTVSPQPDGKATAKFRAEVSNPKLWSAELPNLYTLVMELCDEEGNTLQTIGKRVGFKEFYMEGKSGESEMRINGQNIEFYGVNRGEAHPRGGRHIPYETIVKDVQSAKQLNINAIRTSHFPPDPNLIELADEYGLYIMDEVNVETHNARTMTIPDSAKYEDASGRLFPGNDKRYQNAMVDRMTSMVMRDKNNASVLIYSLGNETGTDASDRLAPDAQEGNFNRMIDVIKELDEEKLIHYQGWNANSRVDMTGSMYPDYPTKDPGEKPGIMMEYQHSMGNTGGDFENYTDAFEASARQQGGFLWDYVDQSVYTPKDGQGGSGLRLEDLYFGFDGSWKQHSGDLNFCGNGIVFPDRTWHPQAYEVKYWYQDLKFTQTEEQKEEQKILLKNFNRFKNANYYEITWTILEDGKAVQTGTFTDRETDLEPLTGSIAGAATKELTVPYEITELKEGAEYLLKIEYKLKSNALYANKGYVQGMAQFTLPEEIKGADKVIEPQDLEKVQTQEDESQVTVTGTTSEDKPFVVTVNKTTGLLTTYRVDGKDLISRAPVGSFFRGETDQNAAISGTGWASGGEAYDGWYEQGENMQDVSVTVTSPISQVTKINVSATLQNGSKYATSYSVYGNGTIVVTAKLTPSESAPSQLGEFGMWMQVPEEFENLSWYGRGPSETYWNRKDGSMIGLWDDTTVTEQFVSYLRLQENGNKTDVRWIALQNDEGEGLLASMTYGEGYTGEPLEAVALHYTPASLSTHRSGNRYAWQAEAIDDIALRLLNHQKGVGNRTWSDEPIDAVINKTDTELLEYTYTLMPLSADTDPMEKSKEILGELPEIPQVTSIGFDDKIVSGFQADVTEYTVALPTSYEGLPVVTAKGPSTMDIQYEQVSQLPGTATVTASYENPSIGMSSTVEYKIHFQVGGEMEKQLSDLVTIPSMTAGVPLIHPGGNLLYAYSGYSSIFEDANQNGTALTTGPASAQTIYEKGFAGNTEQILDIDISEQGAKTFSGVGGIDWAMKAGNSRSTINFEVWVHKDVSVLTEEYYQNPENIDPEIASRGTADWTETGWIKLAESGTIAGNAANPKYEFENLDLTYMDGDEEKSYEAIRLVMDVANGSNSHDQGVWGNPKITMEPDEFPGSGFEEPGEDSIVLKVNGIELADFDPQVKEYDVKISYGTKLPQITAEIFENGAQIPVTVSELAEVPGDVTVSYDNGTPVTYTLHVTRDEAIEGSSVYLTDVVKIPELTGPEEVSNGNLLYAYSALGGITQDGELKLRQSGQGQDAVIKTYNHGFAGNAQQVIDIDLSSQSAGIFRADVGIDWTKQPDTGESGQDAPTVQFEVWANRDASQLDYSAMNPSEGAIDNEGWVKLAASPVMSNGDYSGDLDVERNLYSFNVDLTYQDGRETKSYQALRLVMNPVDGSNAKDAGIWADPRVDFADEDETDLMSLPILDDAKMEITENGIGVPMLLEHIDTNQDRTFRVVLAAYDSENQMVGCTERTYNAKDTGGNVDETITVHFDAAAVGDVKLAFMIWDEKEPMEPLFGTFIREGDGGFEYHKLPFVNQISEQPGVEIHVDAQTDAVTISGAGFQPNSDLTLRGMYEKVAEADHVMQITCDETGEFSYTYTSNYDLEENSYLDVIIGGQGLENAVTATTRTSPDQGRLPVTNTPGAATYHDKKMDLSKVDGLFAIDANAGEARYTVEAGGTGAGEIGEDGKTLTVTHTGTIRIGLVTAQTETHASGKKVIAVLTVGNMSDRSALREAIAAAEKKEEADYGQESFLAMQEALEEAREILNLAEASEQQISEGALQLLKAITALVPEGERKPDPEALQAAITLAQTKDFTVHTQESWARMQTALAAAEETAQREDAAAQEILDAANELLDAIENLVPVEESTYVQDFNASASLPEGWEKAEYTTDNLVVGDVAGAPAGYPEGVTGNALHASGSGNGTRGTRVGYSEKEIPDQAVFEFDFYIKSVSSSIPNLLYLEQGELTKPENGAEVKDLSHSFFALADGMTKGNTLQYYDYTAQDWVDIPGGSGKWLHAKVSVDFAASSVSFEITDESGAVLAQVTQDQAMTFSSDVTTFNRMTMAAYRGSGATDCDIWLDNFAVTGVFPVAAVQIDKVTPSQDAIEVASGTSLEEVKAELAKLTLTAETQSGIAPVLRNDASYWEVKDYNPQETGDYTATASISLPDGYEWALGAFESVEVTVTVAEEAVPAERRVLLEVIGLAESKNEADYTPESFAKLQDALNAAREAAEREDLTQDEADAAAVQVIKALAALEPVKVQNVDKAVLRAVIQLAEKIQAQGSDYTPESAARLQEALDAAKATEQKAEADQNEVNEAALALADALSALERQEAEAVKYTVTLNANGGTVTPNTLTVEEGTAIGMLPTPTREGYVFLGWYTAKTGGEAVESNSIVARDVQIYAHWKAAEGGDSAGTPNQVTVTFANKKDALLKIKGTVTRRAQVSPADGQVTYSSSNPKVASVNAKTGKVTAKAAGAATITAACQGKTDSYRVLVKPAKVKISSVKSPKKGRALIRWKKVKGADGYEIQVAASKKKLSKAKTIRITKASAVKRTITRLSNGKKLSGGKKIYVRMRAYTKADSRRVYGAYSEVKTCKIKK